MTIAKRLSEFLEDSKINFDVVSHPYAEGALDTAHSACIPIRTMAKAVVLEDDRGLLMAVMPSNNKLMLNWLNRNLNRHLKLVEEDTLQALFTDCKPGAIPAMGQPWGMMTACDNNLSSVTDIYLEGGNHRELVHMHREQYQKLMQDQIHDTISCAPEDLDAYKCSATNSDI
ncbi:YbaK/EbsC family protein [Parendozoicomonas sp. Alg238-R29]|uniref:aminoacyl-tRNA deacylase n=1 Tax=Parendozoicomonas sp. Alg238-R29 TaxID=2993446 RepID=UPI00248EB1E8|nr:YbaK/EbsC family protein [Parendozoicomonas sp. Alg238-R29]